MSEDLDGQFVIKKGGGKPRPYYTDTNIQPGIVGAGLAPALQISPTLPTSPALTDAAQQTFLEGLRKLGLELTEQQSEQFFRYQQELLDWNTRINLTAINDPDEVLIKHFFRFSVIAYDV